MPVALAGFFLFLFGPEAVGVILMLLSAACIVGWTLLSARLGNSKAGGRSIAVGILMGIVGLFFFGLVEFRLDTNGGTIGLVATSCGGIFLLGGIAILAAARPRDPVV